MILPLVGFINPSTISINVVLPIPLSPNIPMCSFSKIEIFKFSNKSLSDLKPNCRFLISRLDIFSILFNLCVCPAELYEK